jgi:hypothetical protein
VSADLLRRAAARIREVAEAVPVDAEEEPWFRVVQPADRFITTQWDSFADADPEAAELIALLHPAVALAVADLLDAEARFFELAENWIGGPYQPSDSYAFEASRARSVALARLILGEPA